MKIVIFGIKENKFIKKVCNYIEDNEYYYISYGEGNKKEKNINIRRIGGIKLLFPFKAVIYAMNLHKMVKFDYSWGVYLSGGLSSFLFRMKVKVDYVLSIFKEIKKRNIFIQYWINSILRKAKTIHVISKDIGIKIRKGGNKSNIVLIPLGVDLGVFKRRLEVEERKAFRERLDIDSSTILGTNEGKEEILRSINFILYKLGLDIKLVIFGKEDKKVIDMAERLGIIESIVFEEEKDNLELVDIFISEDSNSILEAMSIGIPVIGKEKDIVEGIGISYKDKIEIGNNVKRLINDTELYKKISKKEIEFVKEKYNSKKSLEKMKRVFKEL